VKPGAIAVVISTFNAPDFLRLTLEGYRQQSDPNFSVYIADDGSGETTKEQIDAIRGHFPVPLYHIWQENDGFRKARIHNQVVRRIKEPYTLLTDGDCIALPGLVAAHRKFAAADFFISGSRVLLSEEWTRDLCRKDDFITAHPFFWWLKQRLNTNINRLLPLVFAPGLSAPTGELAGIRGCHLSCPTEALRRINGFDEAYEGWGREDSDLVARLLHAGYRRRNLRGQPVLHLWHDERSRHRLEENDAMLQACLNEQRIEALCGLKQLEESDD